MRKHTFLFYALLTVVFLAALPGCEEKKPTEALVQAAVRGDISSEALNAVSVILPEDMTRETVSNIQQDFIWDGKQVGGIVIVDIPDKMLDSPYEYLLQIADLLGQQLMPNAESEDISLISAGGNDFAYLEIFTGKGEHIHYVHYLFRGQSCIYDIWFSNDLTSTECRNQILSTVSAPDITPELNKSPF